MQFKLLFVFAAGTTRGALNNSEILEQVWIWKKSAFYLFDRLYQTNATYSCDDIFDEF